MPEIRFNELAISEIKKFIHGYEEAFFNLYKDSGLLAEKAIIEQYRLSAKKLNERIFLEIESRLQNKKVLGRKNNVQWGEIAFHVGDRLIVVYFSEDRENNIRWIESIGINRKPIIF